MKPLPRWVPWAIIAMLVALVFSLCLDLRISRANERESSRRLYEAHRTGLCQHAAPHATTNK